MLLVIGIILISIIIFIIIKNNSFISGYSSTSTSAAYVDLSAGPLPGPDHPVLQYQKHASRYSQPANIGDQIRPNVGLSAGPIDLAYDNYNPGPYPGVPLNIPVPRNTLKETSEEYKLPFYYQRSPLESHDYFRPYGPNYGQPSINANTVYASTPFYSTKKLAPALNTKSGPHNIPEPMIVPPTSTVGNVPFISSVNAYAPFPEVYNPWEKVGIVTSSEEEGGSEIMNLMRMPIAPLQDLYRYSVQDKDGFIILLRNMTFLEDGDIIKSIPGKTSKLDPSKVWKVHIFVGDKYVWV